jgi:hypothetical protein
MVVQPLLSYGCQILKVPILDWRFEDSMELLWHWSWQRRVGWSWSGGEESASFIATPESSQSASKCTRLCDVP